jgi:hypothetical protein
MEHTDAVDDVEAFRGKRKREHVRLEGNKLAGGQILRGHFRGGTEIDADDTRAPACRRFGEAAHAASDIEDKLALEFFRPEGGLHAEVVLGLAHLTVVELRSLIAVPLKSKTGGVLLRVHKACDPVDMRIRALTARAEEAFRRLAFESPAAVQTTQDGLQVSGQGRLHLLFRGVHKPPGNDAAWAAVAPLPVLYLVPSPSALRLR